MSSPRAQYINELMDKFRYGVAWLPNRKLRLGDVGVIEDDEFRPIGSLEQFGIKFGVVKADATSDLKHYSEGSVSVTFKAAGAGTVPGSVLNSTDAGLIVEFSRKNSVAFEATGCRESRVDDQITLGKTILELYRKDQWPSEWTVITELVHAEAMTVLIASSSSAKIELKASAAMSPGGATLANAAANLGVVFARDMHTQIVTSPGTTPLLHASGIKGVIHKSFGQVGMAAAPSQPHDLATAVSAYRAQKVFGRLTGV